MAICHCRFAYFFRDAFMPQSFFLFWSQEKICREWGRQANVSATLLDSMRDNGYEMNLYGKVPPSPALSTPIQIHITHSPHVDHM